MGSKVSFWEKDALLSYDIIIVGGGIIGMSVAASLAERWPKKSILIFERGLVPAGASTRNAGFACFGSLTEVLSDIDTIGQDGARFLLENRWKGLQITRKRLRDQNIGFEELGGFEVIDSDVVRALGRVDEVNHLVGDFIPSYIQTKVKLDGVRTDQGQKIVSMHGEGQLHSGKLMRALEAYCSEKGVRFRTGASVGLIEKVNDRFKVQLDDAIRDRVTFSSSILIDCRNAFSNADIEPGRGQVLLTEPISDLKFRGNLHIDEGFYYLRSVGSRILFGGGRNLDFEGEQVQEFGLHVPIQSALDNRISEILDLKTPPKIDMRWSGIMGFTKDKRPIVRLEHDGLLRAVGMGGMGIALAGRIGEMVKELIEEKQLL
jgi:gamma-glutamylputrescine oxidase